MKSTKLQSVNSGVVSITTSSNVLVQRAGRVNRTEKEIDFLEQQIPNMAEAACKSAYWEALNAGLSVICSKEDKLWEISPDGTRRCIKDLDAGVELPVGTRIKIRKFR